MLNNVRNNSKSGLCIKQIIGMIIMLAMISTSIQFVKNKKQSTQVADSNRKEIAENIEQEMQIAELQERKAEITTRTLEERTIPEEKEEIAKEYKTIEQITIAKDMDLTQGCGISKEDFKVLMTGLKKDTSGFFENNSDTIYDLCQQYELNEIFFCGLIAAESGWNIASNHRNANNYISMMSKGKLIRYASPQEGLEAAAKLLHNKYLTEGGSCYNGKTLESVKKRFCPNSSTWVNLVYKCMKQVMD